MTHVGTYDFEPDTAPLDDRILATVDRFHCDCRSAAWDRTVTYFWAITLGVTLGTIIWWGLVTA